VNELLASARDFWDKLSERERMLLGATGALAALVAGFFLVLSPLLAFAERTSSGVGSAEQQLELMKRLQRDYAEVTARLAVVEKRIRARGQNSNLLTLLESLASSSGVKQTVDYLNNIERSPQLLSVKSLRVKRRTDKTATLDVTFAVSSFEPL
jgi:type II secretory pathway component PulM